MEGKKKHEAQLKRGQPWGDIREYPWVQIYIWSFNVQNKYYVYLYNMKDCKQKRFECISRISRFKLLNALSW